MLTKNKLDKLAETDEEKAEILDQSTMNCWQGVFPLKNEPPAKAKKPRAYQSLDDWGNDE